MSGPKEEDDEDLWAQVRTPVGQAWSGRARYAAAMEFYQRGEMSAETLEIYRICCRLDNENPLDVLRRWKVGADWLARFSPDEPTR